MQPYLFASWGILMGKMLNNKSTLFQVTLAVDNILCKTNGKQNMR